MIKTITVSNWPEIEKRINTLPEEKKQKYEVLKLEYEKAVEKDDHERISELMSEANRILSPRSH